MITHLRRAIAVAVALVVVLLTMGRVRVSWTGRPGASDAAGNGRAAVETTTADVARQARISGA